MAYSHSCRLMLYALVSFFTLTRHCCFARDSFKFDLHHRYSDAVREILPFDDLPEKGTLDYYAAMVHRDRFFHARRLASTEEKPPLTFSHGNETYRISSLGFLHYANVTVGTPAASYLVALDTGSNLFWLPCDCVECVTGLNFSSGSVLNFNIYSPNTSSTSKEVPCSSSLCEHAERCNSQSDTCPYRISYLSNNTSSTGYLVEDLLHLTTNDDQSMPVDAKITLGCGKAQSGAFLEAAAPNGLFGLGIENISVPSILANQGLVANSFSLCFGPRGMGRIEFGDKGSTGQSETPFNLGRKHPTYNISITQISVGGNVSNLDFTALFDSGTSFTYLNDPAYSLISDQFNSVAEEKRYSWSSAEDIPFEYCYELSPNQTTPKYSEMNLTLKGGAQFYVNNPLIFFISRTTKVYYCLAVARSRDINIIGQNFMSGYHIVFDREKMVLGWKKSNCSDDEDENSDENLPTSPSPAPGPATTPATALDPEATSKVNTTSQTSEPSRPARNNSSILQTSAIFAFLMMLLPFLFLV